MREVVIEENIKQMIANIQSEYDFKSEMGGVLAGLLDAEQNVFRITDMSFPYESDKRDRCHFSRNSSGHQEWMDKIWQESNQTKSYLGEWHTHDEDIPVPSRIDRNTWKRISRQENNFDECFFMIIGRRTYGIWTVKINVLLRLRGNCDDKRIYKKTPHTKSHARTSLAKGRWTM